MVALQQSYLLFACAMTVGLLYFFSPSRDKPNLRNDWIKEEKEVLSSLKEILPGPIVVSTCVPDKFEVDNWAHRKLAPSWEQLGVKQTQVVSKEDATWLLDYLQYGTFDCPFAFAMGFGSEDGSENPYAGDGHRLCKLFTTAKEPTIPADDMVVYSFGVGPSSKFEDEVANWGWDVSSFDPTCSPDRLERGLCGKTQVKPNGVKFFDIGISGMDSVNGIYTMKSIPSIMKMLGHDHIDILKMDIESWEWFGLLGLLVADLAKKVTQIALEFHFYKPHETDTAFEWLLQTKGNDFDYFGFPLWFHTMKLLSEHGFVTVKASQGGFKANKVCMKNPFLCIDRVFPACGDVLLVNTNMLDRLERTNYLRAPLGKQWQGNFYTGTGNPFKPPANRY